MQKSCWLFSIITFALTALLVLSFPSSKAFAYGLAADSWESVARHETNQDSGAILVSKSIAYVAKSTEECNAAPDPINCYANTAGVDSVNGTGTGLRDAVEALNNGDEILILNNYEIKDNTVLIDKNLTIRGFENAHLTYAGSVCDHPMLLFTAGGTLSNLTITSGSCSLTSRNLIEINSDTPVFIEHNTLRSGNRAIHILNNTGTINVAFNQIDNNKDYAVFNASTGIGTVKIYANNITNNRTGYQVSCNGNGSADHNFWGENQAPANNAANCGVSNAKGLGAPILVSSTSAGVSAIQQKVESTMQYAFEGQVGVKHDSGSGISYDIIIVNHGHGAESNIPFLNSGAESIEPCSNFYDIFLLDGASPDNLILALKYDLNVNCVEKIASSDFCGQTDSSKYPLWWYDPANNVTGGWDRTGQVPDGPGSGNAVGQETVCDTGNKELRVTIDNTGRPNISLDLGFTPFVVGLPIGSIQFDYFSAEFKGDKVDINWGTTSENNIKDFYLIRSDTPTGTYTRIASIDAIGDPNIGGIYSYTDSNITFTKTYYYKLQVINEQGDPINRHGPASVLTATATPTVTLTRTPTITYTMYPSRTATPYYYRSPTSYYRPSTSTPSGGPTQIRTYGPSPTGLNYVDPQPTLATPLDKTTTPEPNSGYPLSTITTSVPSGYPAEEDFEDRITTATLQPDNERTETDSPNSGAQNPQSRQKVSWFFLLIGLASGMSILGTASVILVKTHFK